MRKFVTLDCLVDSNDNVFTKDVVQNLRHAVLAPIFYRPCIEESLKNANFKFHRASSVSNFIQDYDVGEGRTLLTFWGYDSCCINSPKNTASMMSTRASSCSSIQHLMSQEKELRSTGQQTDISCRLSGLNSPVTECEERAMRAWLADSMTVSSPSPSPAFLPTPHRSTSILGSVCALLLSKQAFPQQQGPPAPPKEVPSYTGSLQSDICRICFSGASSERLVRPCGCRGTVAAVHRACLERWLLQAATSYCELCRHHYVVTRTHKWSWSRSVVEWLWGTRGRALLGDAWRGAALCAASVLGTQRALHACDLVLQAGARRGGAAALAANFFSSILIGFIGALNGLLTTWMLLKIQEHQLSWQAWRDSTLHVHVSLEDSPSPTPPYSSPAAPGSSATLVPGIEVRTIDRATNIADPFMVSYPLVPTTDP